MRLCKQKQLKKVLAALMSGLVIASTIIPAFASGPEYVCGLEEHAHTADCYEDVPSAEYTCKDSLDGYTVIHTHDDLCYQDGELVCPLEEIEIHSHTADCYTEDETLVCESGGHVHSDDCYSTVSELSCTIPEQEGHSHDEGCYGSVLACAEEHEHMDACYASEMTCGLQESEEHTHTDSCYTNTQELTCGQEENAHTHDESCYETSSTLTCDKPEIELHSHSKSCYEDGKLVCAKQETLEHQHTEDCISYGDSEPTLVCSKEEHSHSDACLMAAEEDNQNPETDKKPENMEATEPAPEEVPVNGLLPFADGDTVTIGGVGYPKEDFQSMADYLISAVIVADGQSYDLMAGENITGINMYQDFDVLLNLMFQTSSAGTSFNQLYTWQLNGIELDEPQAGMLENQEGIVYGEYYIDYDGTIYAVLNEIGLQQSIIDWSLEFSALWKTTEDGRVEINLGNGNSVSIELDMSRADISKEGHWSDEGTVVTWDASVNAYDNIGITKVEDEITLARYHDLTASYLNSMGGQSLGDILTIENVALAYTDMDGIEQSINIPIGDIEFDYGSVDDLHLGFAWTPEAQIGIKAGTEAHLTYDMAVSEDFYNYCMLADVDLYRYDNDIRAFLEDGESDIHADAFIQFMGVDLIKKDGRLDDEGIMHWTLRINEDGKASVAGAMVVDTLLTDIEYLPDEGMFYYPSVDGSFDADRLEIYQCSSQEEFDSIVEAPEGVSPVYIYGNQLKWVVPETPADDGSYEVHLYYKTTSNDVSTEDYMSANDASLGIHEGWPTDNGYDGQRTIAIEKTNSGIRLWEDGRQCTTWTITATVYPGAEVEWFNLEEYMPNEGDLVDTIILTDDSNSITVYDADSAREKGVDIRVTSFSGEDITDEMISYFRIQKSSSIDELYAIRLGDANHQSSHGGFDTREDGYQIKISFNAYLNGDAESFKEHENRVIWYYTDAYANIDARSSIMLPHIDNSDLFTKKIVGREMSEDGNTLTLTYDVRYNIGDITDGEGYVFSDTIENSRYIKYREGSLEVYWLQDPLSDNSEMWSYEEEDSPYYGETNLLKVDEDVLYRVEMEDGSEEYLPFRMATILSETESGWECEVPYYKRTPGFYWRNEESSRRFFSPQFIYKVDIDIEAMSNDDVYVLEVSNEASAYLRDGTLDAVATNSYEFNRGVLQKSMLQTPSVENGYTAVYQLLVDAHGEPLHELERIDIIDEMSSAMNLTTDTIAVEYSDDGLSFEPLEDNLYRLYYDGTNRRMTCVVDNSVQHNYYRVTYEVQVIGMSGATVSLSNKAYVSGFRDQQSTVDNVITISNSSGTAEGATAKITLQKYNADNLLEKLPGADFVLERVSGLTSDQIAELNALGSKGDILNYLDGIQNVWVRVADGTTNSNGEIVWENGVDGVSLPLATLFRLTETSAPEGYKLAGEPTYFYLSADYGKNESSTYLSKFDVLNYDAVVFVENQKGYLQILKVDETTGKPLEGAVFGLYSNPDLSEDSLVQLSIDYGSGQYYFGDIPFGETLYLSEIVAPDGYDRSGTVYTVTVSAMGDIRVSPDLEMQDGQYVITNKPSSLPVQLPDAGAAGSLLVYVIGVGLVIASGMILQTRKEHINTRKRR